MNISTIKVGHRTFAVDFRADVVLEDDSKWADYDERSGIIRIATLGRPSDVVAEKLLHEIEHALIDDSGGPWSTKEAEKYCTILSPRRAAFMRDNPEVVREILKSLR